MSGIDAGVNSSDRHEIYDRYLKRVREYAIEQGTHEGQIASELSLHSLFNVSPYQGQLWLSQAYGKGSTNSVNPVQHSFRHWQLEEVGVGDEGDIEWTMGVSGVGELGSKIVNSDVTWSMAIIRPFPYQWEQ